MVAKKHNYELIARILKAHPGWTYKKITAEYIRRGGPAVTRDTLKTIVNDHEFLKALKGPLEGPPPQRQHNYDLLEELIALEPALAHSPTHLEIAYRGITGRKTSVSTLNGYLMRRRARLREESERGEADNEATGEATDAGRRTGDGAV